MVHALHSLGETARCCLLLRTIEQMPYAQIAQLLEIPEGTAMSHVHRSRMTLRGQLADTRPAETLHASRRGEEEEKS
jgi:RNA polymerase sigma-70 factor (ECF subfamily)